MKTNSFMCTTGQMEATSSLTKGFNDYPWSSYPIILSAEATKIRRKEVLELYGGKEGFIQYHRNH